jgi:hypothetical protein
MATTVTSTGYTLHVTNNNEICDLVVTVLGDDGNQYHLHDHGTKKQAKLVSALLAKLAQRWPDVDFQVQADDSRTITGVS